MASDIGGIRGWHDVAVRDDYEEDGVFRPVRLPLRTELMISAAIVAFVAGSFGGFIYFLAQTQGR
ncbi:hypothetical protein SAMN05192575_10379 [Nocardioides alpinus]|uniref:Uncharacterized protein n=1 Tax=Nocardioides alpinus TaxID=748909 RepID=A0A1I0XW64_9ACTN|nr:hypothetical protein SAMN05192575_10379 [Nocardioides alpinus]